MYCSKSNKEALEYHVKSLRTQFINVFMVVMSENHANSKFPSKAGYYNCWIHVANISSEAVIFTVFKLIPDFSSLIDSLKILYVWSRELRLSALSFSKKWNFIRESHTAGLVWPTFGKFVLHLFPFHIYCPFSN